MGVNGLWTVVQPCARPTNLATLNRKRLAVDASIWIYQFLKAVRDKEGNALRNSHVVGFFRRICKLLWFGVRPVFVFDGGAPALKRQTITNRKRRREGRREDAARTAGKLLAVQLQRRVEEEGKKHRRRVEREQGGSPEVDEPAEEPLDLENLVYVDELGMSEKERQRNRKFFKQDAYHLPDLDGGIEGMGRPEDPRIMSIEELEEYARHFHRGEDINLYDFSKIDFEGEFFKSLPPADRYNILNAARIRSRLRMGLSKEQLDGMFPDRMAFSRFQIERVRERNKLTQRLMHEVGMTGTDLTLGANGGRIAGEKDREYILVKNEGAEGGWALGVFSKERDRGEIHKPIDVDALDFQYQTKEEDDGWEDDDGFEDVPIEGLNRLPKMQPGGKSQLSDAVSWSGQGDELAALHEDEDSLFVGGNADGIDDVFQFRGQDENLLADEEEELNRAIAMSLENQFGVVPSGLGDQEAEEEGENFEDVLPPEWTQKAAEQAKPITSTSGSMIAHIVNNRANAAVPKAAPRRRDSNASSDSDFDLRAVLSKKKQNQAAQKRVTPVVPNVKNPFDGPLPFQKLDWSSSIFANKEKRPPTKIPEEEFEEARGSDDELAGGFVRDEDDETEAPPEAPPEAPREEPRPLPPWLVPDGSDIRESIKAQRVIESQINEDDREAALEEERRRYEDEIIEIESSTDDESDVEILEAPPAQTSKGYIDAEEPRDSPRAFPTTTLKKISSPVIRDNSRTEATRSSSITQEQTAADTQIMGDTTRNSKSPSGPASPDPNFEEVEVLQPPETTTSERVLNQADASPEPTSENVVEAPPEATQQSSASETAANADNDDIFGDGDFDEDLSDPEEEELLAQMAEEAEEHARFASQLNHKSEKENQEAYERELKALRLQQKKDRRDADEVTQIMITECQALLRYFGIPYITAPMEAEAQCAELVRLGLVDGIVTDDSDTFLFGGTRVYKNMFNSNKFVECYLGSDLEKELSLSREQLVSLAQLLGSDYTDGLPGVGPVTAVEILSEFPGKDGLANFREWWQDVQIHGRPKEADQASVFRRKFRKSQGTKLFLSPSFPNPAVYDAYLHPEVDKSPEQFQWGVPDVAGLRQFLMNTIGWSEERTDEVLVPVVRDMNRREVEGTQSNITRFFEGGVGVGAKEAFAPRQRAQGSKRMKEAVNKLRANAAIGSTTLEEVAPAGGSLEPATGRQKRKARETVTIDDDEGDHDDDNGDGEYINDAPGRNRRQNGSGARKTLSKGKGKGKGGKRDKRAKTSS
ncbi:PIN domain-like protein [Durotheca rogersii]|uniref:PIN domain-like protein n=1 Tax=Durotheca rogersii TaxID=419775 RepID=UPI00221F89A0|nr:PIN domain-like protein [Durotheca rogersii]KAI5864767.1 PIN domain-like protein [Durotheca rogersii]